jgi:hypothetical protein
LKLSWNSTHQIIGGHVNPAEDFGDQTMWHALKQGIRLERGFQPGELNHAVSSHAARHIDHVSLSGPGGPRHGNRLADWAMVADGGVDFPHRRCRAVLIVDGRELRWHFGPGLLSYRIALEDIEAVAVVRNHWWNGFGIRMRPGFRLYNVSGLDAVELHLRSNDIRRIGTDDPRGLAGALKLPARGGVIG